jgi:hypothetical protein
MQVHNRVVVVSHSRACTKITFERTRHHKLILVIERQAHLKLLLDLFGTIYYHLNLNIYS